MKQAYYYYYHFANFRSDISILISVSYALVGGALQQHNKLTVGASTLAQH